MFRLSVEKVNGNLHQPGWAWEILALKGPSGPILAPQDQAWRVKLVLIFLQRKLLFMN